MPYDKASDPDALETRLQRDWVIRRDKGCPTCHNAGNVDCADPWHDTYDPPEPPDEGQPEPQDAGQAGDRGLDGGRLTRLQSMPSEE